MKHNASSNNTVKVPVLMLALFSYISVGSIFYHLVEKWNWLDSVYFSVISLATVGYGDFVPKTDAGKIFTMAYVFVGIGLFIFVANSFLRHRFEVGLTRHSNRINGEQNGESSAQADSTKR